MLEVLSIGIPFQSSAVRSFETQLLSLLKLLRVQRWFRVRADDPVVFDHEWSAFMVMYYELDYYGDGSDPNDDAPVDGEMYLYENTPYDEVMSEDH